MKKLLPFAMFFGIVHAASAQYCGNSGPSQCTASGTITQPGLSPMLDSLPPFENGVASTTVIQFRNFNTVFFGGNPYTLQSLTLDSITNLPIGLCWASDRANNTYLNSENGCIKVNGTPCDSTGQYKLHIIATAVVIFGGNPVTLSGINANDYGLKYFVRVENTGDPDIPVDTLQPESDPFYPYGGICQNPPPSVSLGADQSGCSGNSITFSPVITNGQVPFSYAWQSTGDPVSCDTCPNPSVTLTQNSTFILTVTDSNSNTGTDTVNIVVNPMPSVTVSPAGPAAVCQGSSIALQSIASLPVSYLWQRNGANLNGATNATYSALLAGSYRVVVTTTSSCADTSNSVVVTVNGLPGVTLTGNPDTLCTTSNAITLTGGSPSGGSYSGTGVTGTTFNSSTAGAGSHSITYSYTDGNNCTNSASQTIVVRVCTGINENGYENVFSLYPNPAKNTLQVESDLFTTENLNPAIYDITGRDAELSYFRKDKTITFDISSLQAGSYWIKINLNGNIISKKFVKTE